MRQARKKRNKEQIKGDSSRDSSLRLDVARRPGCKLMRRSVNREEECFSGEKKQKEGGPGKGRGIDPLQVRKGST